MAGTEELLARLTQLENGYYGDKEAARQKQFFDTYGSRFSNNRGLGMAILNELDARGIDTSAADEAVQQILDQLRMECQEILDMTKEANQAAVDTAQHVEEVANAVSQAITNNPSAEPSDAVPPEVEPAEMPPEMMDAEEPNMDALNEEPPAEEPAPAEPPAEGGEPPAEESAPAEEQPAEPPAEELPPEQTVSDARMKRIDNMRSRFASKSSSNSFKPSAGMIAAAKRGY